jgi:hypothetical protein
MKRRSLLKLGVASAALLALGGGGAALVKPGVEDARLTSAGREVFAAVARGVLDGTLPTDAFPRAAAIEGLLDRIDALIAGLPPHAQSELSQLLALLAIAPGRRALAGLAQTWTTASIADIQSALQDMRLSSSTLRRQAYQALHDIASGAYFSAPSTWGFLGYPGPVAV